MRIHFVGIGGIGMSALAIHRFLSGDKITGSDLKAGERFLYLKELGIDVFLGHSQDNLSGDVELVVATRAVSDDNPELIGAREYGIEVVSREEFLLENVSDLGESIAITGTDGKTTTTAMVFHILKDLGEERFAFLGGIHESLRHGNYHDGNRGVVFELDESVPIFSNFKPTHLIITNSRGDHLENFPGGLEQYTGCFKRLAKNVPGVVVTFWDDELTGRLGNVSFGIEGGDVRLVDREVRGMKQIVSFNVGGKTHRMELGVPGFHNCLNALAAVALVRELGYDLADVLNSLRDFTSVHRRFTVSFKDEDRGIYVIDDYAHTPEEIFNLVETAREVFPGMRITAIFQPHRYTRTRRENGRFASVLSKADRVYITDVYDAFERDNGVDSSVIIEELERLGVDAEHLQDLEDVHDIEMEEGVYLFIGAGDITEYSRRFIEAIGGTRL